MTSWFARVGVALAPAENAAIVDMVADVAQDATCAITALASWQEVAAFIRATEFDSSWWDQEEQEREWLWTRAAERQSESALLRQLDEVSAGLVTAVRAAAQASAAASGVTDLAIVNEATGAALLAAQQQRLAELAGEADDHRFIRKYALFRDGRWPLGYHAARFVIF
jgi:hypothetical protein